MVVTRQPVRGRLKPEVTVGREPQTARLDFVTLFSKLIPIPVTQDLRVEVITFLTFTDEPLTTRTMHLH